jgi:hypothetical protein
MGLFSSAAAVVGDAGGGTLASVVAAVVVDALVVIDADVAAVSVFAVLAGVQAAMARTRNA